MNLGEFDRIIVLDPHVAAELALPADLPTLVWDVPDPYGGSLEAYRSCVAFLRERIEGLQHATESTAAQLLEDVSRWRRLLPNAESTYCQGIANKAAKNYEALIKRLVQRRMASSRLELSSLLSEIRYAGRATSVNKLPLGVVTQLMLRLMQHDAEISNACPQESREVLTALVEVRNETTHELSAESMRSATGDLLGLIEKILSHEPFAAHLDEAPGTQ